MERSSSRKEKRLKVPSSTNKKFKKTKPKKHVTSKTTQLDPKEATDGNVEGITSPPRKDKPKYKDNTADHLNDDIPSSDPLLSEPLPAKRTRALPGLISIVPNLNINTLEVQSLSDLVMPDVVDMSAGTSQTPVMNNADKAIVTPPTTLNGNTEEETEEETMRFMDLPVNLMLASFAASTGASASFAAYSKERTKELRLPINQEVPKSKSSVDIKVNRKGIPQLTIHLVAPRQSRDYKSRKIQSNRSTTFKGPIRRSKGILKKSSMDGGPPAVATPKRSVHFAFQTL